MTTSEQAIKKPLWLQMEETFLGLDPKDVAGGGLEGSIHRIAGELDNAGYNVSHHGGNLLELRWAIDEMRNVGRPMMKDFNEAVASLTLEDVADPFAATDRLVGTIGEAWPKFKKSRCRIEVVRIIEQTKLDLLIAKAKGMADDTGIRMLIEEKVAADVIINSLGITAEKLAEVNEAIKKERAEVARVETLLKAVEGKPDDERTKHLFDNDVSEKLIMEMGKIDQATIDRVKKAIEAGLKEKQRLAEEEAARKKAEAEGPALDAIPADQMLDYIESVREILEFSDQEKEIRVMCEQSSIPKALVDIAVSDPDKLDELEKAAEG